MASAFQQETMMQMTMRTAMILCCAALAAAAIGCGDSGPTYEIGGGTLAGKINGTSWKFSSGFTDDFLSDDKGYFTTLYPEKIDACGSFPQSEDIILLSIPKKAGDYELGFTQTVTLAHGNDNKAATEGLLSVTSITDTTIEAGVFASFNDDYEVDGHFTATICPKTP